MKICKDGRGIAFICFVMLALAATPLIAQEPTGGGDASQKTAKTAADYYKQALEAHSNGDFERAAELFREAYELRPEAILLYNIGVAEWKAGHFDRASSSMSKALEQGLKPGVEVKALARVQALRVHDQSGQVAEASAALGSEPSVGGPVAAAHPVKATSNSAWTWVGASLVAVGAGAVTGALILDYQVGELASQLDGESDLTPAEQWNAYEEMEQKQRLGVPLLIGGGVSILSGLTFIYFATRPETPSTGEGSVLMDWSVSPHTRSVFVRGSLRWF